MALVGEAAGERDAGERFLAGRQQMLRMLDPLCHQPAIGRDALGRLEGVAEIAGRESHELRQVLEIDRIAQMTAHEILDAARTTACRALRPAHPLQSTL